MGHWTKIENRGVVLLAAPRFCVSIFFSKEDTRDDHFSFPIIERMDSLSESVILDLFY